MSEYQYYEFQAIDQPLSREEMAVIDKISSRTTPTATMAAFTYHYGDFKADEEEILTKYYDAMLYMANWGSRRLMFRFPEQAVDFQAMKQYAVGDLIEVRKVGKFVILDINPSCDEPSGGWLEGEGLLSDMLSLRADLMDGDYRTLYLAWLLGIENGIHADEDLEPPVPDGLGELDEGHETFIEFFEIREDLVAAAAEASAPLQKVPEVDYGAKIALLTPEQKDGFLLRLAQGEPGLQASFRIKLQGRPEESTATKGRGKRSSEVLEKLAKSISKRRETAEKTEREKARIAHLTSIIKKKVALWKEVYALIELKNPKNYTDAVAILKDLKAAAEFADELPAFEAQVAHIRRTYKSLTNLMTKLKAAGM